MRGYQLRARRRPFLPRGLTSHKSFGSFTLFAAAPLERRDADEDTAREDYYTSKRGSAWGVSFLGTRNLQMIELINQITPGNVLIKRVSEVR